MDAPFPTAMLPAIEQFLAVEPAAPPQDFICEDVFDLDLFAPLQRKNELRGMLRLAAAQSPQVVMEIGADKGGGLYHWCRCLPTVELVIGAEIRGTPYHQAFERAFPHLKFGWISASSYAPESVARVETILAGRPIDVLFIDGDKANFLADFQAYLPYLAPQPLVFLHDIRDPAPGQAFRQLQSIYQTAEIVDTTESAWAVARQRAGIPPRNNYEAWLRHWKGASCGVGVVYVNLPRD